MPRGVPIPMYLCLFGHGDDGVIDDLGFFLSLPEGYNSSPLSHLSLAQDLVSSNIVPVCFPAIDEKG